jgi:hypothetical protein
LHALLSGLTSVDELDLSVLPAPATELTDAEEGAG